MATYDTAGLISGGATAVAGLVQQISAASTQKAFAKYAEKMAIREGEYQKYNSMVQALALQQTLAQQADAEILDGQRAYATGQLRAIQVEEQGARQVGTIRATEAARGVVVDEGSPLLLQLRQHYETELAAINERFQGETASRALQSSANAKTAQRQNILASAQTSERGIDYAAQARAGLFSAQAAAANPLSALTSVFGKINPLLNDAFKTDGVFGKLFSTNGAVGSLFSSNKVNDFSNPQVQGLISEGF